MTSKYPNFKKYVTDVFEDCEQNFTEEYDIFAFSKKMPLQNFFVQVNNARKKIGSHHASFPTIRDERPILE